MTYHGLLLSPTSRYSHRRREGGRGQLSPSPFGSYSGKPLKMKTFFYLLEITSN